MTLSTYITPSTSMDTVSSTQLVWRNVLRHSLGILTLGRVPPPASGTLSGPGGLASCQAWPYIPDPVRSGRAPALFRPSLIFWTPSGPGLPAPFLALWCPVGPLWLATAFHPLACLTAVLERCTTGTRFCNRLPCPGPFLAHFWGLFNPPNASPSLTTSFTFSTSCTSSPAHVQQYRPGCP